MRRMVVATAAVVALSACVQVLGDDFTVGDGGSSSSSSAVGGGGGSGGNASSSSVGGGGGTGDCTLGTSEGCEQGEKCTALDMMGGIGCIPAGPDGPNHYCEADTECTVGTFCDPNTMVCEAICPGPGSKSTCGLGWCVDIMVPNYGLCTAGCDPTSPNACPDPELTCAWWGPTENNESTFHCAVAAQDGGSKSEGDPCTLLPNIPILHSCAPGLVCVDDGMGTGNGVCLRWCEPVGQTAQCTGAQTCLGFPLPIIQGGVEYGACL